MRTKSVPQWTVTPGLNNELASQKIYADENLQIGMFGEIAYIYLGTFSNNSMPDTFYKQIPKIKDAKGFIFDVRYNGGGNSGNGDKIAAAFTGGEIDSVKWRTLEHIATFKVWKQGDYAKNIHYKTWSSEKKKINTDYNLNQPVVILTGRNTASAAEDFLSVFDAKDRAIRVGESTYGSTGQPLSIDLPGGGSARICTRNCQLSDSTQFINVGILPHVPIELTLEDYQKGIDRVLLSGIDVLTEKIENENN